MADSNGIPLRNLGSTGVQVTALGLGGHHLGDAEDDKVAIRIVQEAADAGINFFDNCWEYHRGHTEEIVGAAMKGRRDKVFLMSKVCTHGRDKALAMKMLEETLRRMQTDHLDLWQIHGVTFDNDADLFSRPNGAHEALTQAKKQGKVRFVGFTGHKDPGIHLKMLKTGYPFDTVQMPLNPFDHNFCSFEKQVLPEANRRRMGVIGMKPFSGHGEPIQKGVLTAQELLRYAMSLPVSVTISGVEKPEVLQQNLKIARGFQALSEAEMQALRDRVKQQAGDGRFELYKTSIKFDNPESRLAHDFPLDLQSVEVKEMLGSSQNNGKPYPKYQPPQK